MYCNEITEEMWDKIEAEGIVVLKSPNDIVNFAINYRFNADEWFPHIGDELEPDLVGRLVAGEGWGNTWNVVNRPASMVKSTVRDSVVEWLDRYVYVFDNSNEVGALHIAPTDTVYLATDFGDIHGTVKVVEFINDYYERLQKEAKSNKQKELAEKKAKLLEELSAIDKELEGV